MKQVYTLKYAVTPEGAHYAPGRTVLVTDETAKAWLANGTARSTEQEVKPNAPAKQGKE